ncbi:MAG: VWA domain-containing protein, partial [Candidatus Paceibacterota bacterium]
ITLLTDGIATRPLPPEGSGQDVEAYPKQQAIDAAHEAAEAGVSLFVIGLGSGVSEEFLRELAPTPDHYFYAPSTDELDSIYQNVATSICKKGAAVVRILTRVLPE